MDSRRRNGFTLIELMIAVAVLAIALGAGVPSMSEFIKNSRLSVQTHALIASLHLARTEANKRNAWVTLCKSAEAANLQYGRRDELGGRLNGVRRRG
ncbi:MAG: GspH/FimT family pseudopilin [Pseudomonadota bacterium]|nr:GspH/FimT family pseudopilin [Gammaproteobacteria bacterium]MDQ3580244.1 GspH/FimT family pseudopilin [Pseudomonadota bacterium]